MSRMRQLFWLMAFLFFLLMVSHGCMGQLRQPSLTTSSRGSSTPLSDEELDLIEKEKTRNVVKLAATDQLNSEIITNRTRAYLNCESGEMIVKINFSQPFRGVAYSDYDRSSPCKFYGDGGKYYEMRLPLKGCGTKQEAPRLFINNIIVRFHRSLELEEDEIKTIICRYPPPQAPPPPSIVAPILEPTVPVPVIVPAKLSEIELLLIICALLFLTLLLLGIGIAYYCLKRRNIKIIRKKKLLSPAPSEITKVSTIFDQIRIPRATTHSTESSDTIPSDYPSSESDERRTIVSETSTLRNDHFRYENTAFVPEPYPIDVERDDSVTSVPLPVAHKPVIQSALFSETLLETENIREEDIIDTHHKRTTACLYKKLPTTVQAPSIPDNDNWSQTETESCLSLAWYVKPHMRPKITSKTIDETYLSTERDRDVDETVSKHKKTTTTTPPKLTLLKTDDVFVTNISETEITEKSINETRGAMSNWQINIQSEPLSKIYEKTSTAEDDVMTSTHAAHHQSSGYHRSGHQTSGTRIISSSTIDRHAEQSEKTRGEDEYMWTDQRRMELQPYDASAVASTTSRYNTTISDRLHTANRSEGESMWGSHSRSLASWVVADDRRQMRLGPSSSGPGSDLESPETSPRLLRSATQTLATSAFTSGATMSGGGTAVTTTSRRIISGDEGLKSSGEASVMMSRSTEVKHSSSSAKSKSYLR